MSPAPRIVFFGMPLTGKTGLLHAFADPEAPFPLSKYGDEKPADLRTLPNGAVLVDVDGRGAKEIIDDPERIANADRTAAAVREADAIVLALDASATGDSTIDLFRSFATFLEGLVGARCENREVGGLPVFLTLTKSDRLHRPGDDPNAWLARVEEKKRTVRTAFEDYLAATGHGGPNPDPYAFGSIDVHVAATALRFPDGPAFDALEAPFGIEELRHDCSAEAFAHARRADRSHRRLRWTLAGSGSLVGAMAIALLSLFALSPPSEGDRLGRRVKEFREREGPPAHRLADRQYEQFHKELRSIRDDDTFDGLPEAERKFVAERLAEFAAYREYRERFLPPRIGPAEVRSKAEADKLEAELATDLAPPTEYAGSWAETEAVRLAAKWARDLELVRAAEARLHDWYRGLVRRGTALLVATGIDPRWRLAAEALLAESETPPFKPDDAIPGSEKLQVPRGAPVPYSVAFESDRVERAAADWLDAKNRLLAMRDLGDALGMTGRPDPALRLPEPTNDPAVSAKLAATILPNLGTVDWSVGQFPDPMRVEFRTRLRQVRDLGLKHVHAVLRAKRGAESRESWATAATWLDEPDAKAWGQFLAKVGRWAELDDPNPIDEAAAFLKRLDFSSDLTQFELTLPNDLRDRRLIPKGLLVIRAMLHNATEREFAFRLVGEPKVDGTVTVYRFVPDGHDGKPTFRPGETVTAKLSLKAGEREYRLDWDATVSTVYSFERLSREPTLRSTEANAVGERAAGVRLAAPSLPRLPAALRMD